ncbi:MAG: YciI family protein [Armatimonadetes bacterium]|nr:YciI family protein [Armatimonadota bacterium]
MMLVYPDHRAEAGEMPGAELVTEMMRFNEELAKAGALHALDGLHPTSKGARITYPNRVPKVVDGPFTESKEVLGGFWIIDVASKEEAIEWAKKVPNDGTGMIEVRQVYEMNDFPQDVQRAAESDIVREAITK